MSQNILNMIVDWDWFQYDLAYGDFKCLLRRKASDKVLPNKAFKATKII